MAHPLAPGRRSSLPSLPTLISQWSPHIAEPAVSLTGEGAALAAAEGARLPDLHSRPEALSTQPPPGVWAQGAHRPSGRTVTCVHPAPYKPGSPSQPECLLKTPARSCNSLLKSFGGLPVKLRRSALLTTVPGPLTGAPAQLTDFTRLVSPHRFSPAACPLLPPTPPPPGRAPAVLSACHGSLTPQASLCHLGLDLNVPSSERIPQLVAFMFSTTLILKLLDM